MLRAVRGGFTGPNEAFMASDTPPGIAQRDHFLDGCSGTGEAEMVEVGEAGSGCLGYGRCASVQRCQLGGTR